MAQFELIMPEMGESVVEATITHWLKSEGDQIEDVTSRQTRDHPTMGYGHREVALEVSVSDGFHARDETHACIFLEEFGFAKMSHRATIYQLNFEGQIIGQENYQIRGDVEDMAKLTNAVDAALTAK